MVKTRKTSKARTAARTAKRTAARLRRETVVTAGQVHHQHGKGYYINCRACKHRSYPHSGYFAAHLGMCQLVGACEHCGARITVLEGR